MASRPSNPEKRREIQQRAAEARARGEPVPKRDHGNRKEHKETETMSTAERDELQAKIAQLESQLEVSKGSRQDRKTDRDVRQGRKARGPMGGSVQKLACTEIPGYHIRWVNDEPGRIQMFLNNDYEHVTLDDVQKHSLQVGHGAIGSNEALGNYVSSVVGRNDNGSEKRAYLMKIKEEWYSDDQKAKMKAIDDTEKQYKEGNVNIPDEMRYKVQENQV